MSFPEEKLNRPRPNAAEISKGPVFKAEGGKKIILKEIPVLARLGDDQVGCLLYGVAKGFFKKSALRVFRAVFTRDGDLLKGRGTMVGEPFVGPDGLAVLFNDDIVLGGNNMLEKGLYAINSIHFAGDRQVELWEATLTISLPELKGAEFPEEDVANGRVRRRRKAKTIETKPAESAAANTVSAAVTTNSKPAAAKTASTAVTANNKPAAANNQVDMKHVNAVLAAYRRRESDRTHFRSLACQLLGHQMSNDEIYLFDDRLSDNPSSHELMNHITRAGVYIADLEKDIHDARRIVMILETKRAGLGQAGEVQGKKI